MHEIGEGSLYTAASYCIRAVLNQSFLFLSLIKPFVVSSYRIVHFIYMRTYWNVMRFFCACENSLNISLYRVLKIIFPFPRVKPLHRFVLQSVLTWEDRSLLKGCALKPNFKIKWFEVFQVITLQVSTDVSYSSVSFHAAVSGKKKKTTLHISFSSFWLELHTICNVFWQHLPSQRKQINISHAEGCQKYHRCVDLALLHHTPFP